MFVASQPAENPPTSTESVASRPLPFDPDQVRGGIVHIGVGGFHRAHLALYAHELAGAGETDWGIVGVGMLPGDRAMAEALRSQDHRYTLIVRGPDSTSIETIGSLVEYILVPDQPDTFIDRVADPVTQIVSLTITEGGYPVDDVTGRFVADSANAAPDSAFGHLVTALAARRDRGAGPVTILSCDNVVGNGGVTRDSLFGVAEQHRPDLIDWLRDNTSFPNSMVDRITPATTDADRAWLAETHGVADAWPVVTEHFRQWVVEDAFAGDRPPLESLDILITDDVEPYEQMKLRLLNAGHSCLAYVSALLGVETVAEAMRDQRIRAFTEAFMRNEALPALDEVAGIDLDGYVTDVLERFANPNIGDQIARLCLDGSAKLPKFLMPTVRAQLERGGPIDLSVRMLASWAHYLAGPIDELSSDPALDEVHDLARQALDTPEVFLTYEPVFGDLVDQPAFRDAFVTIHREMGTEGVDHSLRAGVVG